MKKYTDEETDRWRDRQIKKKHTDKETDRWRDRHKETQTHLRKQPSYFQIN